MHETDENKNKGNLRMQNVTGNEFLAAPMSEESPTSLYPHVHILNNRMPVSSNISESLRIDPSVFHSSGNAPPSSIVSTHGNAPSTSSTFMNNRNNENTPHISNNGNVPNSNGNAPVPPPYIFVILEKINSKK